MCSSPRRNAPERPEEGKGIKGTVMKRCRRKAGAAVPSANRITLLRDADGDGVAETATAFLEGLNSPFGMALVGNELYVANTDAIVKFAYTDRRHEDRGAGHAAHGSARRPAQSSLDQEHHREPRWLEALRDGRLEQQRGRERHGRGRGPRRHLGSRRAHRRKRLFATGLRNPNGIAWEPSTGSAVDRRQ